jgi:diguanylate cyclase (GGDEF)-like protein
MSASHAIRTAVRRVHRVWWLNAGIAAAAFALADAVAGYTAIAQPHIPWWVLAIAIAICERWPVDLEFQRSKHSFSLTDIPIVLGLIFATGFDAMFGLVLGTAIAMLGRRLPLIKFVFNIVQFLLAVALGALTIHLLAGAGPSFGPRVWVGAMLGLQAGGVVTVLLLAAVISIADGRISLKELRQMFGMDLVVTAANTSLALIAAMVVIAYPSGLPILLVPVLIGFVGYRTYVREHERHKKVEFLYQANRSLAESPEVAVAVEGLLERAREAFRAEYAEVIFFGHDDTRPLRSRLDDGHASLEPVDARAATDLRALTEHGPVAFTQPLPEPLQLLAGDRELRNAMAAVLRGKDRVIGTILLANRVGLTRGFGDDDLALFETLAANASAALQFDRLEQAVIELRDLQQRLHHQAFHDSLTGLANRALFTQEVTAALQAGDAAVLFIDLDDFKGVNDTLGHAIGDQLLSAAASRIARAARDRDLVARLGGDEFAVLVRTDGDIDAVAARTARDVIAAFEAPISIDGRLLPAHVSVGVATSRHSGRTSADLLRDADVGMYEAKAAGKGRFAVFTPDMRDAVVRRHTLREELSDAIEREHLHVHYQPIVDLATGEVAAVEALVRWQHPEHGRIPPLEFIPLAEETALIVPLGRYVLRRACAQAVAWTAAGGAPISVQVNLSARELEDPDLIDNVRATLDVTGLAAERLTLEITETLLVRDAVAGGATLDGLRALGIRLALDDFGTGYSSLSYMRALPLQSLKIAKEFIDGMTSADEDEAFVRLIVELARLRGLSVVAEGIETQAQLDALRALGCDRGQGYLFARPLDANDPALLEGLGAARLPGPVAVEA